MASFPARLGTACNYPLDGTINMKITPSALTVIKRIALADGCLSGHENYMTKLKMIKLAKLWLAAYRKGEVSPNVPVSRQRRWYTQQQTIIKLRGNEIQRANEAAYHGDIDGDFDY